MVPTQASPKRHKLADMGSSAVGTMPIGTGPPAGFQPQLGAKRLVIQNLRKASSSRTQVDQYYERTRKDLDSALQAIFAVGEPDIPRERLYRGVEDLCRAGKAESLYATFKNRADTHLKDTVLPRIERNGGNSTQHTLHAVLKEWVIWNERTVSRRETDPSSE